MMIYRKLSADIQEMIQIQEQNNLYSIRSVIIPIWIWVKNIFVFRQYFFIHEKWFWLNEFYLNKDLENDLCGLHYYFLRVTDNGTI